MSARIDTLTNVERPIGDRPVTVREMEPDALDGYWHGSATDHIRHWRARALVAEGRLAEARAAIAGWRPAT